MGNLTVSPFEAYEMLTEVDNAQKKGRLGIRICATGEKESYSTLNVMSRAIERILGKMANDQAFHAMRNNEERGEIVHNLTYGYLMGSPLEHDKVDDSLRNELVGRDLGRLVYVGSVGGNNCAVEFMCEVKGCTCRYRARYTSGYERGGADRAPLSDFWLGGVEIRRDILDNQLEEDDLSEGERGDPNRVEHHQQAMGESERRKHR